MNTKTKALTDTSLLITSLLICTLSFAIPFFISGPQLLTGSVVNCFLFLTALRFRKILIPVIILPAVGALLHGILFGPFTIFLFYFLPIIWTGNFILIQTFRYFRTDKNLIPSLLFAASLKAGVLYLFANIFYRFNIVPKMFINAMGMIQLITAICGGLLSVVILRKINSYDRNSTAN